MARPVSVIESHPQRQRIIDALASGTPYRDITSWTSPPVTPMTLSRFKRSAVDRIIQSVTAAKVAIANNDNGLPAIDSQAVTRVALLNAADPFLTAVAHQTTRRARWMKDIEDAGDYSDNGPDYKTLAVLDRNDQSGLELHARLAGRLDAPAQNQTNIMIVCPAEPQAVQEPDVVTIDIGPRK